MKHILILIASFCVLTANGQDYYITFSGSGASNEVVTVKVENLPASKIIILNGTDILHLRAILTVIRPVPENKLSEIRIYPNPLNDYAIVEINPPVKGYAQITVNDITGRQAAGIQVYLENSRQELRLSGLGKGFYLITVTGTNYKFSEKLISQAQSPENISIEKVSFAVKADKEKAITIESKGIQATIDMPYTDGDKLKFTGISGNYVSVETGIITSDRVINFNFSGIECHDADNNNYPVVLIGSQIWMAENLKTTKYDDVTAIPLVTDQSAWSALSTPGYCWYDNDAATYKDTYGALYNWYTVHTGHLCPTGWHVPTHAEWITLENYMIIAGYNYDGTTTDDKIAKALGSDYGWALSAYTGSVGNTDYPDKRNISGFTALPAGARYENSPGFDYKTGNGFWWAADEGTNPTNALGRNLYCNNSSLTNIDFYKIRGFSVRCLRNNSSPLPLILTREITSITENTAASGGNVLSDGGFPVTDRGVCWSTIPGPTIGNYYTYNGTGTGQFTCLITGLTKGTTYFVRAFAMNASGISYGQEKSFTTIQFSAPELNTIEASEIVQTSALSGGNVTNDGFAAVTERGICWSLSPGPTISDNKANSGTGTGVFLIRITGLAEETTYFARAYATNSLGTSYGNQISFTTEQIKEPSLTTAAISAITQTTAISGGNVNDEGATLTARGVCCSTSENPTIADNHTSDGTGTGYFSSSLTGLTPKTRYYVRAYATNRIGTGYGNTLSFTTRDVLVNITDIDGNTYTTIYIGDQAWMTENLKTTKYNNGDLIGTTTPTNLDISTEISAKYQWTYNGDEGNAEIYGRLYTWFVVNDGRKICPTGWHVPADAEWTALTDYLGGSGVAGGKLKEAGLTHWKAPNSGATNESGFTGLPGGYRSQYGLSYEIMNGGYWWSSTEGSTSSAWERVLGYPITSVPRGNDPKQFGFSVRCIKDL